MGRFREPFDWEKPRDKPNTQWKLTTYSSVALMRCCKRWETDDAKIDHATLIPGEGYAHLEGLCPRSLDRCN